MSKKEQYICKCLVDISGLYAYFEKMHKNRKLKKRLLRKYSRYSDVIFPSLRKLPEK